MNFIKEWAGIGALIVFIAMLAWPMFNKVGVSFGAAGGMLAENYIPYVMYNDGYKSEKEIVLSGANGDITTGDDLTVTDDLTVSGGVVAITTAPNATSTLTVGCQNYYATSSATQGKLVFVNSATSSIDGTAAGLIGFKFGSC